MAYHLRLFFEVVMLRVTGLRRDNHNLTRSLLQDTCVDDVTQYIQEMTPMNSFKFSFVIATKFLRR